MSLRVIMFPAVGNRNENRYIDILVAALRRSGVIVVDWHKHFSLQSGDIFHIHWPDVIADIRKRTLQRRRGDLIFRNFLATIRRIKHSGGKIAWTVHDLRPHDHAIDGDGFNAAVMSTLLDLVDIVFSLTESGKPAILEAFPQLSRASICLARHPHYRAVLPPVTPSRRMRDWLGISPNQRVLSFLGTMRPNKRPDLLSATFAGLSSGEHFLIMAGGCPNELATILLKDLSSSKNAYLRFESLSEKELLDLYSATDVSIFPAQSYFNSGTIYTSLSLNVPVIAARSPQTLELQKLVGQHWLYLYDGDISPEVLATGSQAVVDRSQGLTCDLSPFDPDVCARQHIEAYRKGLERRPSAYFADGNALSVGRETHKYITLIAFRGFRCRALM